MSQETLRTVTLERIAFARFCATNVAGDSIEIGEGGGAFSAVELLLAALASCTAADIDYITNKRAEPEKFSIEARADKIRDEGGNRLTNLELDFKIVFPEGDAGDSARAVLPTAIAQSRDRLCTVARTLALANDLAFSYLPPEASPLAEAGGVPEHSEGEGAPW